MFICVTGLPVWPQVSGEWKMIVTTAPWATISWLLPVMLSLQKL